LVAWLKFNVTFQHKYAGYIRDEGKLVTTVRVMLPYSNATRAPIANPPNSAQIGGIPTIPPSYIRVRAIVWACGRGQTDRHTQRDERDHNTFRVVYDSREMYPMIFSLELLQCFDTVGWTSGRASGL